MLFLSSFILLGSLFDFSHLLPQQKFTPAFTNEWKIVREWEKKENHLVFEASSSTFVKKCESAPHLAIAFPEIDQAAYEVFVDGRLLWTQGDPNFESVHTYYGSPVLSCELFKNAHEITYKVYAYARFYTYFRDIPKTVSFPSYFNVFAETIPLGCAAVLMIMGLFTLFIFRKKAPKWEVYSLSLANILLGNYFLFTVSGLVGIHLSMIVTHRITEASLWLGMGLYLNGLRLNHLPGTKSLSIVFALQAFAILVILSGSNGDTIQWGSVLGMVSSISFSIYMVFRLSQRMIRENFHRIAVLDTLSLGTMMALALNDVLVATQVVEGFYLLPFGSMGGLFFYNLSINEKINQTFRERDYLRENLEKEVQRKTVEIQSKNDELQKTILELKETQAELVQSARLVSLGTLAAGIAHEINNALNYVNASIRPLEKLLDQVLESEAKAKSLKLTKLMSEGLKLTFDIIASLRNYTGLNQAKFDEVNVKEVINSVLLLIKSKLTEKFQVSVDVPNDLKVYGSIVGLNQVFMNLISNAIGAMPEGGKLFISAQFEAEKVILRVEDCGTGIAPEIVSRIFEPFFTTKEVGSGTGLGLYIVKREMERQGGQISVTSELGKGTCFSLTFPVYLAKTEAIAA